MKGLSKNSIIFIYCLPIFSLLFSIPAAHGDTRYVTDQLVLTLRAAPESSADTIKTLKTDDAVEVLEESDQFLKVRITGGEEGWVLKHYVTSKRPKSLVINELRAENNKLKSKLDKLDKEVAPLKEALKKEKASYSETLKEYENKIATQTGNVGVLQTQLDDLNKKHRTLLEESKDEILLIEERDRLKKANFDLSNDVTYLRQENERMKRSNAVRWFLAGGGVFLIGIIFGKSSRKKKYY